MKSSALLALCLATSMLCGQPSDELAQSFARPPATARPHTFWMWMNGNVTADGITRDLEAMQRVGLGGAVIFNPGTHIPKGPVAYGSAEWQKLMVHAAQECSRLGLELAMHNAPGWSSSGGPWITPEFGMQELVWSETHVTGGQRVAVALPRPHAHKNFYRDVAVLAFPSLPGEERRWSDLARVTRGEVQVDPAALVDANLTTKVAVSPQASLVLEFAEPFEARALTLFPDETEGRAEIALETSDDGVNYRVAARLRPPGRSAIKDAPMAQTFAPVRARFFRIGSASEIGIGELELHAAPRIPHWNYKANFDHRGPREEALPEPDCAFVIQAPMVRDLTAQLDAAGRINWDAPPGAWTIVRFGHTASGRLNEAAPDAGVGLESDKMSRVATELHFSRGIQGLLDALGPLVGKTFTGLEIDSYEVGMQNWTAAFPQEFQRRNGYDVRQYLLAMTGRFVDSAATSEKFLWDVRRTQAQLVAENYYGAFHELCRQRGLTLYVEPYGDGPGPSDDLQVATRGDVPMGEFWLRTTWDATGSLRLAASGAHTSGTTIVAGEAFTGKDEHSRWLEHPFATKTLGDFAFSQGINHLVVHRFAHQPHPSAVPGMTMGPWGMHFDRTNTWFEQSGPWLEYLARCQFLLRQGRFIADVLYFGGEGSPRAAKYLTVDLPRGYDFDVADAEVLLRARVENSEVVLPSGMRYRLLALPPDLQSMTIDVLRKLQELVAAGATLVGPKPQRMPTLAVNPNAARDFQEIADELWNGKHERVFSAAPLANVLAQIGVKPDFAFVDPTRHAALTSLHRRVGDADVYFVANLQRYAVDVQATFRVAGRQPELWRPETGEIQRAVIFDAGKELTSLPLHLGPAESVFVVFRSPIATPPARRWVRDGVDLISATPVVLPALSPAMGEFTVSAWINPETNLMQRPAESLDGKIDLDGKSCVLAAPANAALPRDSAVVGLAAGRNGVIVFERTCDRAPVVLSDGAAISGWTHLALVYRDGRPSLYLNGKFVKEGLASGLAVRPGIGFPAVGRNFVNYFDGDLTRPEVFPEAFPAERIAEIAARGVPGPDLPPAPELMRDADGTTYAQFWQNGCYMLDEQTLEVRNIPAPSDLRGRWLVDFEPNRGAPAGMEMMDFASLHLHPDPEIRFFSGTATYHHRLKLRAEAWSGPRRLYVDLGRISVVADVSLNGRKLATVWKPPFRVDLTDAIRTGLNFLEVRVTNLWPNRLIGDEMLPEENRFDPLTRAIERLPDWYLEGKPKPARGRTTFTTWKHFTKDDPLLSSGLLGPVYLLTAVRLKFQD